MTSTSLILGFTFEEIFRVSEFNVGTKERKVREPLVYFLFFFAFRFLHCFFSYLLSRSALWLRQSKVAN